MYEKIEKQIVLAIETAIDNGSLSLFKDGKEIDFWIGQTKVSKSEDVLEQIKNLFERNNLEKKSLKLIVVSGGAGSSTGSKIGLSLAKGLSKALACQFVQTPVLESLLLKADRVDGMFITALPTGRDFICWEVFENLQPLSDSGSQVCSAEDFIEWTTKYNNPRIICHEKIFSALLSKKNLVNKDSLINAGVNLAKLIAVESLDGNNASDNQKIISTY